jgi:hypothetical protein
MNSKNMEITDKSGARNLSSANARGLATDNGPLINDLFGTLRALHDKTRYYTLLHANLRGEGGYSCFPSGFNGELLTFNL